MREEIPVAELNVLLKFLQTLGDLPKIDLGEPASRGERLAVWRTAVEAQLRTTRKVVMEWWQWSYAGAEIYYNHWLKLPLLQRNQIKISEDMPMRFQNMEQMWGYPHALSHEGLRAINEFAEAELTAMVINGYANMRRFGVNLMWLFGQKEENG